MISPIPIQFPYAPIKPNKYLAHHQVGTLTLECTRWNRTTEKLITSSFGIINSVIIISLATCLFFLFIIDELTGLCYWGCESTGMCPMCPDMDIFLVLYMFDKKFLILIKQFGKDTQ